MYVVKAKNAADNGWTTIYDSSDKALCLISQPKHSAEINQAGSFDFIIYPDSDFYDAVIPMATFVSAFEGTDAEHLDETFYGRVLTCEEDFYGIKNVGCEGALSFLSDATVGYVSTDDKKSGKEETISPEDFLRNQLTAYNSKVEELKRLSYGGIIGVSVSETELFKIDDYQNFLSLLESQLIDVHGGFFKITRQQDGTHALSYVNNYGIDAGTAQPIKIGKNILDKQKHMTGEGVFTFIRPVGKDDVRLDSGTYHGVSCTEKNGWAGLYPVGTDAASFNALYARYGFIEKTKTFDHCENSGALAGACSEYVSNYGLDGLDKLPLTFDVKLVDFFNANPNVKRIELGANYILTVDSEGRETGFEGHADGTSVQEGQTGLTLTVYSVNREYENPENDSITFYNATYLTAKDYSVILSSMTGSYGGGGSRGGLSGRMSYSDAEMKKEQVEETRKVEKRFFDDEESIGMVVTITENGKVINAGGIWTEITGTDKNLLQGTLDVDLVALRSNALITAINRGKEQSEPTQLTIDFDKLNITGGMLINVINGDDPSKTGDLTIKANKISIDGNTSLNGLLTVVNGGALCVRPMAVFGDARNLVTINNGKVSAGTIQINSGGSLKFGDGTGMPSGFYMIDANTAAHLVKGFDEATEDGQGHISIPYHTVSVLFDNAINFNIAATQFYIDRVAAARDSIQAVLIGTSSKPTSGKSAGSATEGWYYQAQTSYSGTESYTRKYGGYVYVPKYTVKKGSWGNGGIAFTRETTTGEPSTSQSVTLVAGSTTWNENTASVRIRDYDGTNDLYTGLTVTVNATPRYRAGSASVGLASPDWGTAPSQLTDSRTVSVSTTGRVDSNGNADNLTQQIPLQLTKDSTPGSTGYAYLGNGSTSVARIEIGSWYKAGQNSVNVTKGAWNQTKNKITFSPSAGTGSSASVTLAAGSTTWNGNTASVRIRDYDGTNDLYTGLTVTVDASDRYYTGWNDAAGAVSYPGIATNEVLAATLTVPNSGASSSTPAPTKDVLFRVEKSETPSANSAVTAQYSTNNGSTYTKFLRINVGNMYTAGWAAARISIGDFPASTPPNIPSSITVKKPNVTVDGAAVSYEYNLSVDDDYAYLKYSGNTVARVPNTAYSNGQNSVNVTKGAWNQTKNKITFSPSAGTGSSASVTLAAGSTTWNGNTASVRIRDYDGTNDLYTGLTVTVDASERYTQGMKDVDVRITKYGSSVSSWTVQSGDSETFYPAKLIDGDFVIDYNHGLEVTASGGGSASASDINIANSGSIWVVGGWETVPPAISGNTIVDLNSLSSRLSDSEHGDSVIFRACIGPESSATSFKYYRIKVGYS